MKRAGKYNKSEHMNKCSYVKIITIDLGAIMSKELNLEEIKNNQPDDEYLYELSDLFRIFGDSTRIKILYALMDAELCVGDIADVLGLSQSSVSHQLRVLKNAKLVRFRREGKSIFYALDDDHVRNILSLGMEHVEE